MSIEHLMDVSVAEMRETALEFAADVMREGGFENEVVANLLAGSFMAGAVWSLQAVPDADQDLVQKLWDKVAVVMQSDYDKISEARS